MYTIHIVSKVSSGKLKLFLIEELEPYIFENIFFFNKLCKFNYIMYRKPILKLQNNMAPTQSKNLIP